MKVSAGTRRDYALGFTALAVYGVGLGVPGIAVGLFTGPPVLIAALVHLIAGAAAGAVAAGLLRSAGWAVPLGVLLSGSLAAAAVAATVGAVRVSEWPAVAWWGGVAAFLATLAGSLLRASGAESVGPGQ